MCVIYRICQKSDNVYFARKHLKLGEMLIHFIFYCSKYEISWLKQLYYPGVAID